jgi:hypothetical protein
MCTSLRIYEKFIPLAKEIINRRKQYKYKINNGIKYLEILNLRSKLFFILLRISTKRIKTRTNSFNEITTGPKLNLSIVSKLEDSGINIVNDIKKIIL